MKSPLLALLALGVVGCLRLLWGRSNNTVPVMEDLPAKDNVIITNGEQHNAISATNEELHEQGLFVSPEHDTERVELSPEITKDEQNTIATNKNPEVQVVELECPSDSMPLPEVLNLASMSAGKSLEGIVYTTVTVDNDHAEYANWVSNWYIQIRNVGVHYPIVFGVDDTGETCDIVRKLGICCRNFQSSDFSFAGQLPDRVSRDGVKPTAVDFKHFYAFEILSYGYRVSFSDVDVYWFKHPFLNIDFEEDIRGLTDDLSSSDQEDGYTPLNCGLSYGSPCMSTGLWDVYPTVRSLNFLVGMLEGLRNIHTSEQALFNVLLKFAIEEEFKLDNDGPKISFRLFPKSTHVNVGVLDKRKAENKQLDLTAVHLGYVDGDAKLEDFKKRGLWHPLV